MSSPEMKTSVVIDLKGNLPEQSKRFVNSITTMSDAGRQRIAMLGRGVANLSNQIDRLGNRAALGLGGATYLFERTFLQTAKSFEDFQTILETLEGSQAKAKASMAWVTEFAAKTPYELDGVTAAFIKLKSYGMDPMKDDLLRTLGDTSAAMGKPLEQSVEAIADAITGENERLKEFGIKARVQGKRIVYEYTSNGKTLRKVAQANSREQIASTLLTIWNEKYKGSMDKLSQNWGGLWSNLGDQSTQQQNRIMQAGVLDYMKDEVRALLAEIERLDKSGQLDSSAKTIATEMVEGLKAAKEVAFGLYDVMVQVGTATKWVADQVGGFDNLAKGLAYIYLGNKALRIGGAVAAGGKGLLNFARPGRKGRNSTGNPLLDAASGVSPVPVYVVNNPANAAVPDLSGSSKPSLWSSVVKALPVLGAVGTGVYLKATEQEHARAAIGMFNSWGMNIPSERPNSLGEFIRQREQPTSSALLSLDQNQIEALGRSIAQGISSAYGAGDLLSSKLEISLNASPSVEARITSKSDNVDAQIKAGRTGATR